ncbi:THUMP-like domain-containing protein [Propionibacterium sp.]|uniref:THUMP-like domain-containing protein n=1 Tax=Propionibacterium sp. TaxID=1977903 RepID=UPI0039EA0620
MQLEIAQALTTEQGRQAIALAAGLHDPDSMRAAQAMRNQFPPEVAAAALTQVELQRKGRTKLGERTGELLWTRDGLEQATRATVARWRAGLFAKAGMTRVVDLGCGIGADALAFLDAGLAVTAVEIDPATACLAAHNLPTAEVICGDAVELAPELLRDADDTTCVFLDPARRTARGRSWRIEDLSPSWDFLAGLLDERHPLCAKLGPGIPGGLLPASADAIWVSEHGDLVECGLWALPGRQGRRSAVLLPQGLRADADPTTDRLPVGPPGRYLHEPDPALSRAGAVAAIGPGLWRLDPKVAYYCSQELIDTPWASTFEILDVLDPSPRVLRRWVAEHHIGRLEIKKRAVDIDPAVLRKTLRPRGPDAATFILTPTPDGTRALVASRITRS